MLQGSHEREVDLDLFVDVEHEGAGIFEAPLDIGDGEGADSVELLAVDLELHRDVDLVRSTEECEDAVNLESGVAGCVEGSGEAGWRKGDGFEGGRLEFVVGHAMVARGASALAAECVDDDGAGGFSGGGVERDISLLNVEGAVDDVQGIAESEVDLAAGGVERELVLGVEGCGCKGDQERALKAGKAGAMEHVRMKLLGDRILDTEGALNELDLGTLACKTPERGFCWQA